MKQILLIGGGTTFNNQSDYKNFLKTIDIDKERLLINESWKQNINIELGFDYEILMPKMPNSTYAKYADWKIYFERIIKIIDDEIILIGHSLGGIFLAKYLAENYFPKKINSLFLLAAPYKERKDEDCLGDFKLPSNLNNLKKQVKKIYILHSKDDNVVPYEDSSYYHNMLEGSNLIIFNDKGHFNQPDFPELFKLIKQTIFN